MSFATQLNEELQEQGVTLVAVSKTKPVSQIREIYDQGIRHFGENRVQELVEKQPLLPGDIKWHMIGNLQKNKVKYIAPFVHLIHSVSSAGLLKTIDKEGRKNERIIDVLLQIKIAEEDSKGGLEKEEAMNLIEEIANQVFPNIRMKGFMGMATFTQNQGQIKREFQRLKLFSEQVESEHPDIFENSPILSYGMSGDYKLAIEEGSNMVRIGSLIFGAR